VAELARVIFRTLPAGIKAPEGPMSQPECIDVLFKGAEFYLAIKAAASRS
jgi:hypothetical protein